MKIRIDLKDPDGVSNSVLEAAKESLDGIGLTDEEKDLIMDARLEKIYDMLEPWVSFGEYVSIEIDTDKGTASVL